MRILMSGASGFIGKPLFFYLRQKGHQVHRLVREKSNESDAIWWDPVNGIVIKELFEGFDAVIHLAGENFFQHRWTVKQRKQILYSRTVSTWLLSQVLSQLYTPPKVFISPSFIGFFGDRGEEVLQDESSSGKGFLSKVCIEWEAAASVIDARGSRVVHPRMGLVLGKNGGVMERYLMLAKLGLSVQMGSGEQWMSWIALDDVFRAFEWMLQADCLEGSFNLVSPQPVRQKKFAHELAIAFNGLKLGSVPAWVFKTLYGQMGEEIFLSSAKVTADRLQRDGFSFLYPSLDMALAAILH